LLLDGPPLETIVTIVTAFAGVYFVTGAIVGFLAARIGVLRRLLLLAAGVAILMPHDLVAGAYWINAAGAALVALLWVSRRRVAA
jgi:TRAP-type uncharacterized transport system fused permease subunit